MPTAKTSKALSEFLSEAQETIDSLSRDLLALGEARAGEPDPDLVNRIFRAAHTLKGSGAMFGATHLSALAHAAEDLLDDLRMGRVQFDEGLLDLLLEAVEGFQRMIAELGEGVADEGASGGLAASLNERIQRRRQGGPEAKRADPLDEAGLEPAVRNVLTEYEEHRLRENLRKGVALLKVRAAFDLADFDKGLAELNARLKALGEVVSTLPSADPGAGGIGFDLLYGTSRSVAEIESAVAGLSARVLSLRAAQPPSASQPAPAAPPAARAASAPAAPPAAPSAAESAVERRRDAAGAPEPEASLRSVTQTVRVDIRKLDRLMNTVGELVLVKTHLQKLTEALRSGALADPTEAGAQLGLEARSLERRLDELQKGILEVRMVPLEQVFDKLARLVRKIAREAGKEIDFRISGGDVELDKLIIEDLSDPLMHIIRNAIDHGIETPEARAGRGKPRRGTISLAARQKGNHVVIEVGDDGAGIDEAAVRAAAVAKGLTSAAAANDLSRRDVLNFIFLPGFSTAKKVSQLSGRGVGLDVVKTNIANLSGIIDVHSAPGEGTRFAITLPVTLAIIRALVVGTVGRVYALPLNSVLEIIQVDAGQVRTIEAREVVDVRGTTLPLVRLSRLFQLSGQPADGTSYVVVVGLAEERLGIAVEELVGQQDVVIKPLGKALAAVKGIAGATDLGNRRTVLVLDVGAIIEEVLTGGSQAGRQ